MTAEGIRLEKRGRIALVLLDRPSRRNAFNTMRRTHLSLCRCPLLPPSTAWPTAAALNWPAGATCG